jgi:hypothetical protein
MSENFVNTQELLDLGQAMNTKYQHFLNDRAFTINATADDLGAYVTVTLANDDRSFVYPVEARMKFKEEELTRRRAVFFLIDYIDLYFQEFLMEEEEDVYIPIEWADFEWDTVKFQLKGQIFNSKIESRADEILLQAGFDVTGLGPEDTDPRDKL